MLKILNTAIIFSILFCSSSWAISGKKAHEEVMKANKVYEDKALQDYVENIGRKLLKASNIQGDFTFTLIDDPNLNAFAHIGGYVYVHRGLLTYVNSEAQLAAVIAHEIAHVTEGHVKGQRGQGFLGEIAALIVAAASGSAEVLEAGSLLNASMQRSHGRNNELEADSVGAQYVAAAGYDPNEVVEMLSALKNYELYQKEVAGGGRQTYHGLFASHPRNDARLRGVIEKARRLATDNTPNKGIESYRQITRNLIWGDNFQEKDLKPNDYLNIDERIRIKFPEKWTVQDTSMEDGDRLAVASSPEKKTKITLEVKRRSIQSPEEYLYNTLKIKNIKSGKEISPSRLKGFTGILTNEDGSKSRIAVIYYKLNAFIFTSHFESYTDKKFKDDDKLFLEALDSFRTLTQREIEGQKPRKIKWVRATESSNYADIAKSLNLGRYGEQQLRLINNDYPSGEPLAGDWIKIIAK